MEAMTDSEKIAVIFDRTERIEKEIFGNGRPGIVADLSTLKTEVADLQKRAPTTREKQAGWAAILIAVITAVGGVLAAYSGRAIAAIQ